MGTSTRPKDWKMVEEGGMDMIDCKFIKKNGCGGFVSPTNWTRTCSECLFAEAFPGGKWKDGDYSPPSKGIHKRAYVPQKEEWK